MGIEQGTYPGFTPKFDLILEVSGGVLTLGTNSALLNVGDYTWGGSPEVTGKIIKNGADAATLSINSSTGAITASSVSVSTGDHIVVFLTYTGPASWPWEQRMVMTRSAFMDVAAGTTTTTFNGTNNTMPVPTYELTFGWDANDAWKVGVKVSADDGASQDLALTTRRLPAQTESASTTNIDLASTSVQTHVASFNKSGITADWEIDLALASGTGTTHMEDRVRFIFTNASQVPSYPTNFATHGVRTVQSKVSGKLQVGAP